MLDLFALGVSRLRADHQAFIGPPKKKPEQWRKAREGDGKGPGVRHCTVYDRLAPERERERERERGGG